METDIFFKVWQDPIRKDKILTLLTPQDWHILTAIFSYMDEHGECNPSLWSLARLTGLKDISSVSKRIKSLEEKKYKGISILQVKRGMRRNENGQTVFKRNLYKINLSIVSIFGQHDSITARRQEQMEEVAIKRHNLSNQMSMNHNGTENKTTRTNY